MGVVWPPSDKTQISTVTNAPFIQNSNRMAPNVPIYVDCNRKFSEVFFNSCNIQDNVQVFSADKGVLQKLT